MGFLDDVGSAFTGQSAVPQAPRIDPAAAGNQWDDWLNRPGNRTALLQMGLQLMQPPAFGQTVSGQIGQAIGAGGEAVDREAASDLKERLAEGKLSQADEKLRIAQQVADSGAIRAGAYASGQANKKIGGISDALSARFARQDAQGFEKQLDADAKAIVKQASDPLQDPNSPVVKQYAGKTVPEVREMLRATRPKPKYGNVPTNDTGDTEDDTTGTSLDTPVTDTEPPVAGAKQARDGNWYVPDPKRPGKFLRVAQ